MRLLRLSERRAFQIAILNVDVVVKIRVLLRGHNREQKHVLPVDLGILDFEPEFNGVGAGPLVENWSEEADVTLRRVQVRGHVPIIAGNSIEYFFFIHESTSQVATLTGDLEEDILECGLAVELDFLAQLASASEATLCISSLQKEDVDEGILVTSKVNGVVRVESLGLVCEVEVLHEAVKGPEKSQFTCWPHFLHVLVDMCPVEGIAVLV